MKYTTRSTLLMITYIFIFIKISAARIPDTTRSIEMQDRIYWCDSVNIEETPMLEISDCEKKESKIDNLKLDAEYKDVAVLTRDPFEVLGTGYECNKQVIKVTTYTNVFYAKYQQSTIENLDVSKDVCRNMVETKQCGERTMSCEEGVCEYDGTPDYNFSYLTTHKEQGFRCQVRRRVIKAKNQDSQLFGKKCTAKEKFCKMDNSIIVWDSNIINSCPFTRHVSLNLTHKEHGILYDSKNKLVFQVMSIEKHCNMSMFVTSQNLYLVAKTPSNNLKPLMDKIQGKKKVVDLLTTHSILLSELDGSMLDVKLSLENNNHQICRNLALLLNHLRQKSNMYEIMVDHEGNERVFYNMYGVIFMPTCIAINNFTILEQKSDCSKDFLISFKIGNTTRYAYLTTNRIIKAESTLTEKVEKTRMYFSHSKMFVEMECGEKLRKIESPTSIDINSINDLDAEINFPHLNTLIKPEDIYNELQATPEFWETSINQHKEVKLWFEQTEKNDIDSGVQFIKSKVNKIVGATGDFVSNVKDIAMTTIIILGVLSIIAIGIMIYYLKFIRNKTRGRNNRYIPRTQTQRAIPSKEVNDEEEQLKLVTQSVIRDIMKKSKLNK